MDTIFLDKIIDAFDLNYTAQDLADEMIESDSFIDKLDDLVMDDNVLNKRMALVMEDAVEICDPDEARFREAFQDAGMDYDRDEMIDLVEADGPVPKKVRELTIALRRIWLDTALRDAAE